MPRRLFLAAMSSKAIQDKVYEWRKNLDIPVKWVPLENLHITLLPPWQETNVKDAKERLHRIDLEKDPIKIEFIKLSYNPGKQAKLIWAEGKTPKALQNLQSRIRRIFKDKIDETLLHKEFLLHLTVARFNTFDFSKLPPINERISWEETIDRVALVESILDPNGARYRVLDEVFFAE